MYKVQEDSLKLESFTNNFSMNFSNVFERMIGQNIFEEL